MSAHRRLVIGSSNFDLTVYCERLPGPGETVLGGKFASGIGGKGANQATAARRMGAHAAFFSAVGGDPYGQLIREHFAREEVSCLWAGVPADTATGAALILVDRQGQNSIAVAPGANAAIRTDFLESIAFAEFSHVLLSLEIPLEVVTHAAVLAKKAGCRVLLNPAPAALLPEELLKNIDILLPNEHEVFSLLSPPTTTHEECAARLFAYGLECLIVTLGAEGAKILTPAGASIVPGFPASTIDTVGAGDCFCGALTASLATGSQLPEAVRIANGAASLSVQKSGAISSFPHREEVLSLLSQQP